MNLRKLVVDSFDHYGIRRVDGKVLVYAFGDMCPKMGDREAFDFDTEGTLIYTQEDGRPFILQTLSKGFPKKWVTVPADLREGVVLCGDDFVNRLFPQFWQPPITPPLPDTDEGREKEIAAWVASAASSIRTEFLRGGYRSKTTEAILAYLDAGNLDDAQAVYATDGDKIRQYPPLRWTIETSAVGCRLHAIQRCPDPRCSRKEG